MDHGNYLIHHGIKGQKWGNRRYQYEDGSLTPEGRKRYLVGEDGLTKRGTKIAKKLYMDTAKNKKFAEKGDRLIEEYDKAESIDRKRFAQEIVKEFPDAEVGMYATDGNGIYTVFNNKSLDKIDTDVWTLDPPAVNFGNVKVEDVNKFVNKYNDKYAKTNKEAINNFLDSMSDVVLEANGMKGDKAAKELVRRYVGENTNKYVNTSVIYR